MPIPRRAGKPSSERILAAAEALFAERGYAEVSLRQLIAAAGISTTAFYARFDSKAAVLDKLTEQLFGDLYQAAAQTLPAVKSFGDGIDRGVDLLVDAFAPRKPLVRLVIAESGASVPTAAVRQRSYTLLVGFLAARFRALAGRGRITVADPDALAWAIVGALEIHIVRWAVWEEIDVDQLRDQLRATAHAILPEERP
jgi:AcrR family transcriptional regulator